MVDAVLNSADISAAGGALLSQLTALSLNVGAVEDVEGYLYAIVDSNRRLLWGITTEGEEYSPGLDLAGEIAAARGTAASLNARLSVGMSAEGLPKELFANTRFLRDWRTKSVGARLATGLCSLALVGDSWTYYQDASRNYVEKLTALLQAAWGDGGPGWVTMGRSGGNLNSRPAGLGASVVHTGTWVEGTAYAGRGPDLSEITSSTVNDTIVTTVSDTAVTATNLLYLLKSGGGSFRYRFDAGSWTTVNTSNASDALGTVDLTPPLGAHTFTIEVTDAGSTGITVFGANMTRASGVVVHRLCMSGSTTAHWTATSAVRDAAMAALDPDVTQFLLGTNDQGVSVAVATYQANLETLAARRRVGRANADVVFASVPENLDSRAIPMTSYRDSARSAALAASAVFVDLLTAFGETVAEYNTASPRDFFTTGDLIHPQAGGFDQITGVLAKLYLGS